MGGFDDAVIQVPEVAHTPFHFSCAEERSWIRIPAFQKDVSALKYKRFSSSCAASCSMSGFNLRSTDIPVLLRDADPYIFFVPGTTAPSRSGPPHYRSFTITLRHTALGSTPLDEWSARRWDLYLTSHNVYKETDVGVPARIWTRNLGKRTAADPRLRPRGPRDGCCSVLLP